MHGELTDRLEKEIIAKVITERIEAGGDAAVAVEFLLILRGPVQSVCLILRLVIPSHPQRFLLLITTHTARLEIRLFLCL